MSAGASSKACAGCLNPFTAVRKARDGVRQAFTANDGRAGVGPVLFVCGACRRSIREHGGRPYHLPGFEADAQALERLVLAERTGALQ